MTPPPPDLALARPYRADDPRRLFDEGARAWPTVALDVEVFVAYLGRLAQRTGSGLPPLDRGPDLYLACACVERVPGALEAFDRTHLAQVGTYLTRYRPAPELVDDVRQEVRDKLYVGRDGAAPRIAEYDGRGALASWVRVVALRAAIDLRRGSSDVTPASRERADPAPADPETGYLKQ